MRYTKYLIVFIIVFTSCKAKKYAIDATQDMHIARVFLAFDGLKIES